MKQRFLSYSSNLIKKYYPETDDIKMEEYRYNLECFYITVTKALIILPITFIFGVLLEALLFLLVFNFVRKPAHGLHATKSWICLVSSTIIVVVLPYMSKIITYPLIYKFILELIALLLIALFAPADTKKAPIIKKQRRKNLKIKACINTTILIILTIIIDNNVMQNIIVFGIWTAVIMILPLTYKLFKLPYNNYKTYLLNMN